MDLQDLLAKNGGFQGQNGGRGGAMLTPTNSLLLLGFLHLWQFWWKSIEKCDRESAHRRIHWQTDANRFCHLPHATCYRCGADKTNFKFEKSWNIL